MSRSGWVRRRWTWMLAEAAESRSKRLLDDSGCLM